MGNKAEIDIQTETSINILGEIISHGLCFDYNRSHSIISTEHLETHLAHVMLSFSDVHSVVCSRNVNGSTAAAAPPP